MWTRRLSASMAGIEQQDFVQAFVLALSNESVIKKLQNAVCGQLQQEVAVLRDLVKSKDDQIAELQDRVNKLEIKNDDHEQYSRRNSLRISGLEEGKNEDIVEKVVDLFNNTMQVSPPVTQDQFDRVHRTGPLQTNSARQVLVKFATYRVRDRVFRSKRNLKSKRQVPDAIEHHSVPNQQQENSSKQNIFINEDLTKVRSNFLWHARRMKRNKQIQDCWSWDGTILVKNNVAKVIPIHSLAELERLAS